MQKVFWKFENCNTGVGIDFFLVPASVGSFWYFCKPPKYTQFSACCGLPREKMAA